jgi:hypothetical protein
MTLIVVFAIGFAPVARGEIFDEPDAFQIDLREDPAVPRGKLAILEGAATRDGVWMKVAGLSVSQTVLVALETAEVDSPIILELRKVYWDEPLRRVSTEADGTREERFRVQGDLYLRLVSSRAEQEFVLLVWVDDKQDPPMPPVLVTGNRGQ